MDEPCYICGDIGVLEVLYTCSQCKIYREHLYCVQASSEKVPKHWLCKACKIGSMSSPRFLKEDLQRTSTPDVSDDEDHENIGAAGPSKLRSFEEIVKSGKLEHTPVQEQPAMLRKWEKIAKTGKVKYIPAHEAIVLSSGAKKLGSFSKSNMNLTSGPSKIAVPISTRTPIKPMAISRKSSFKAKANPSLWPSGLSPTRNGSKLTNQVGQHQATQRSKEPKEKNPAQAPRKEHFPVEQPTDAINSAVETQNISTKEDNVANKASSASTQEIRIPSIVSSGGNNDCSSVEPKYFNSDNGDRMKMLPKDDICLQGPALDSSWKGSFKILDTISCNELNEGFFAHPPSKVRRKVYEFSKAMPQVLLFTMIPRSNVWTDIFLDYCPGEDDIGLYFFSSNGQRSAQYISLLEFIETQDLVMRSYVDGKELLVFTSKLLPANFQRWKEEYYFWGVFRRIEKPEAVCKHNRKITFPIQSSDSLQDDDANGGDNAVDMEIDMLAGKDVGRLDIVIPGESFKRSCNSYWDENKLSIPVATQKPFLEVKNELFDNIPPGFEGNIPPGIHPGFEEIHQLSVQNDAFTKMGREGKSLMLDEEARNPEKESGRFKSISKVPGAGRLQPYPRSICN